MTIPKQTFCKGCHRERDVGCPSLKQAKQKDYCNHYYRLGSIFQKAVEQTLSNIKTLR